MQDLCNTPPSVRCRVSHPWFPFRCACTFNASYTPLFSCRHRIQFIGKIWVLDDSHNSTVHNVRSLHRVKLFVDIQGKYDEELALIAVMELPVEYLVHSVTEFLCR